jgi:hypothetical protein
MGNARRLAWCAASLLLLVASRPGAQEPGADALVERVGAYVADYYARVQRLLVEETVVLQPFSSTWTPEGFPRRLVYELRIEWAPDDPSADASVIRKLIRASGPPLGSPDQPDCMDPRSVSPEPLAFLLPDRRHKFRFRVAGPAEVDGQAAVRIEFFPTVAEPPTVEWKGDCGRVEMPSRTRGRVWADAATAEVLRLDEHLVGLVDIPANPKRPPRGAQRFTIERADTSIRYQRVRFEDPDETLLLPSQIDSVTIIRDSGVPRLRSTQTYRNYRRFVTDSRIVR